MQFIVSNKETENSEMKQHSKNTTKWQHKD